MNSRRQPLAPVSPNSDLSSPPAKIRTYSRKRKFIESQDPCESASKATTDMPNSKSKKLRTQASIPSFFKTPSKSTPLPTPPTSSPTSPPTTHQKSSPEHKPKTMTQLYLSNLGASTRTTIHCKVCQMHYNKIDPNDQKLHTTLHNSILHGPPFPKPPIPSHPLPTSPISNKGVLVIISRSSPKDAQKRALQLLSIIDVALGAPANIDRSNFFPRDGKVFCLVCSGHVISLVAAERIESAYRRIPDGMGVEATKEREKAVIGISRMWTCISERGKGWCSALLEECAAGFVWGVDCRQTRGRGLVAFSTPSESGMRVATKWTGKQDFLVYDD